MMDITPHVNLLKSLRAMAIRSLGSSARTCSGVISIRIVPHSFVKRSKCMICSLAVMVLAYVESQWPKLNFELAYFASPIWVRLTKP
jgi:hypothetical protein